VLCLYLIQNWDGNGEHFAFIDGASSWPSIAIILFATFLSIHFIIKTRFDLELNAQSLRKDFALEVKPDITFTLLWQKRLLDLQFWSHMWKYLWNSEFWNRAGKTFFYVHDETPKTKGGKVDIAALWKQYHLQGRFWRRVLRALFMTVLYLAFLALLEFLLGGDFPTIPMRGEGEFLFECLIAVAICLYIFLTFVVIDAIVLHEAFLGQLEEDETGWPPGTFEKFKYAAETGPYNESDLSDYWDILLIAKRTEAIANLIYYPFIILSLLIVSRLDYFGNYTWSLSEIVVLCIHFCLAFFAAWRLPSVAGRYRKKTLERMEERKREKITDPQKKEAIDSLIEDVRTTHQGAFAYLWEQPVIRALLLPSSGIGFATISQYLQH
jgi:hypothetical protein